MRFGIYMWEGRNGWLGKVIYLLIGMYASRYLSISGKGANFYVFLYRIGNVA